MISCRHPGLPTICLAVFLAHALGQPAPLQAGPAGEQLPLPVTVSARGGAEPVAAGLIVNGNTVGDLVLYKSGEDYWIPYSVFIEQSGLRESPLQGQTRVYTTSIGNLSFDKGNLKMFENVPCISFSSLKKSFLVKAVFDSHLFAAALDVPWRAVKESPHMKSAPPVPDVSAPKGSLSFLSFDVGTQRNFKDLSSTSVQIQSGGRVTGGVWDIDVEGDPSRQMDLRRYHWSAFSNRLAMRLGTGMNQLAAMMPSTDFTGVQFGWNNKDIVSYLDASGRSSTDIFVSLNRNQNRTIEGRGPVAGIAELRFDGKIVARLRIKLDGRFTFENVRMGADLRKTEVYIYERSTEEKPVAILDYTQSVMNGSLPAGELLVRGGAGASGNPLVDNNVPYANSGLGYAQVQYGLNDRMTLDAGAQYNPVTASGEYSAGSILSLGKNWATSLYGSEANRHYGSDLRIEGNGKAWNFSWWSEWKERNFGYNDALEQAQHWLRLSVRSSNRATLLLYGRDSRENGIETRRFVLPGAYVSPFSRLTLSAVPNEDGHYRYEAGKSFSSTSDIRLIHEHGVASAEWDKSLSNSLKARFFDEYAFSTGNSLTGVYLDWYPRNSRFNLVEFGASRSGKEVGFSGKWNRYLNAGLKVAIQYSWNMVQAQNFVTTSEYADTIIPPMARHFFACTVSWDLGFSGRHPFPIDRSAISTTRGGLAGKLDIAGETKTSASNINDVGILLNGKHLDQRQVDGSFFVGNLKPGLYWVTVDTEKLPIELTTDKKHMLVEVKNGSVTNVNIPVHATYGIDGRLVDHEGNGIGKADIQVLDMQNTSVTTVTTNEFGDYRTDGLPSGSYQLKVLSVGGVKIGQSEIRVVNINGDYATGITLSIGKVPEPEGANVHSWENGTKTDSH